MTTDRRVLACQIAVYAAFLGLWELATRVGWVGRELLPPFTLAIAELGRLLVDPSFLRELGATAGRVAIAFVIAAPLSVVLGFVLGERARLGRVADPLIHFGLAIPQSIFLPLLILFFGIGALGKIVFGISHLVLVVLVNTMAAARSISQGHILALRSFGATRAQTYLHLYLPGMLPVVLTGLRLGMIFNILGVLVAEMYASQSGLGRIILHYGESGNTLRLTAAILAASLGTIAVNEAMRAVERRVGGFRFSGAAA